MTNSCIYLQIKWLHFRFFFFSGDVGNDVGYDVNNDGDHYYNILEIF